MQVPISSSIAGVVGYGATRDAKVQGTGVANTTAAPQIGPAQLEKNASTGDRDAQEQYMGDGGRQRSSTDEAEEAKPLLLDLLELPADQPESGTLDLRG